MVKEGVMADLAQLSNAYPMAFEQSLFGGGQIPTDTIENNLSEEQPSTPILSNRSVVVLNEENLFLPVTNSRAQRGVVQQDNNSRQPSVELSVASGGSSSTTASSDANLSYSRKGGMFPITAFNNSWARREKRYAHVVPVSDVKRMARLHWVETLELERQFLPTDVGPSSNNCTFILGEKQINVNCDHRHRIVKWMSEACLLFSWTSQTFFTAVHAWDYYITAVTHQVPTADLAKLSAACLYFGAQLVESAADENVKTLDDFVEMCPEVGSSFAVRDTQAHLVDTLQGVSLVRRTPVEFLMLFLAQMQVAPSPCPELFRCLLRRGLLSLAWSLTMGVSLSVFANGLVLDGLPPSQWVAACMMKVLEFACPALKTDVAAIDILFSHVFHFPPLILQPAQSQVIDPIIRAVWRLTTENLLSSQNVLDNSSAASSRPSKLNRRPNNSERASRVDSKKLSPPCEQPYDIIRHVQPPNFGEWTVSQPNSRLVRDASKKLRQLCFEDRI